MCRMLALKSAHPETIDRLLLDSPRSLSLLSHEHKHGWGLAHYVDGQPLVERGTRPAHEDPEFEKAGRILEGDCLLAHVRKASVGVVRIENCHPFRHGRWTFTHNGTVRGYDELRTRMEELVLPEFREMIRGSTDSERCFGIFLSSLRKLGAFDRPPVEVVASALAQTVALVRELSPDLTGGLTFLASDGQSLVGIRSGERELCFSFDQGRRLLIASEPLAPEISWTLMESGEVVGTDTSLGLHRWTRVGATLRQA